MKSTEEVRELEKARAHEKEQERAKTSTHYTLTSTGARWFTGQAPAPRSNLKVLKALAEQQKENNIPYTPDQLSHLINLSSTATADALNSLITEGYVATARLPQPIERTMTPKPRIRPVEEIVKSELKAQEARRRYDHSDKGRIAHENYETSEKGVTKNIKYWDGERGRLVQKAWRLRVNIKSMTENKGDKRLIKAEKQKLKEVEEALRKKE